MIHPPGGPRLQSFRTRGPSSISRNLNNVTQSHPSRELVRAGELRDILLLGMKIVEGWDCVTLLRFHPSRELVRAGELRDILLLGMKIVAFCDEEQGCPLYR